MTNAVKVKSTKTKKHKIASLDRLKARSGWFFVLPFILGFVLIYLPIIFDSIKLSFMRISVLQGGGIVTTWVGFLNYNDALFVNPDFGPTLLAGLKQLAFDIPAIIIFSLFMAVLLNQKMVGRATFRAIFFIPVILSTGLMASIESQNILGEYMEDESGINNGTGVSSSAAIVSSADIEQLFSSMKMGQGLVDLVVKALEDIYDIVNRSGVQMLIFLAGLQSISPAIYESCQIDGASAWETFWKITFPMISPMILVNAIYTVIDSFTSESNEVMSFISSVYQQAEGDVISSAMSWMYFLIVIIIISILAGIMSFFVFYQRRD